MVKTKVMTWWDPASQAAIQAVRRAGKGSPEILMRSLHVTYCRADFLLKILQRIGILSQLESRRGTYKLLKKQRKS